MIIPCGIVTTSCSGEFITLELSMNTPGQEGQITILKNVKKLLGGMQYNISIHTDINTIHTAWWCNVPILKNMNMSSSMGRMTSHVLWKIKNV